MKTVFKKTLIATAALAFVGTATAATVGSNGAGVAPAASHVGSYEGLIDAGSVTIAAAPAAGQISVTIKPAVTNVEQDVLVVTVAGAKFDKTVTPTLVGGGVYGTPGSAPFNAQGYEFFDYQDDNTIRFRVKTGGVTIPAGAAVPADAFSLTAKIKTDAVTVGSKVVFASKVISLNPVIGEYDKGSRDVISVVSQTKVTLGDTLDQQISTSLARKEFNNNDSNSAVNEGPVPGVDAGKDVLEINIDAVNGTTLAALPVAVDDVVTHVITGEWSFLRDGDKAAFSGNANGTLTSAEIGAFVAATVADDVITYSLSADNSKLTVKQVVKGAGIDNVVLKVTPPATAVPASKASASALAPTKFTADVSIATADVTFNTASGADIGAWTLDGSVVKVPYLVLQEGRFGTVVTVSNSGTRTGEILLDIVDEAGVSIASALNAGTSTPGSIVNVSGKIKDALVAKGKDLKAVNKFSVVVTTNVPQNDVLVYSAYTDSQNGGERAIVNNDSKVQTK